jgi:hypothetical protein
MNKFAFIFSLITSMICFMAGLDFYIDKCEKISLLCFIASAINASFCYLNWKCIRG